jgi:hypothetical protein
MKRLSPSIVAIAVLSVSLYAQAQAASSAENRSEAPAHAVATNLPGVYAFTQPPANFDPKTASAQELASWGYPPRPAASEGADAEARWLEEVNPALQRSVPELVKRPNSFNRPISGFKVISKGLNSTASTSTNWSGYALVTKSGGSPLYKVSGHWTVPTVKQAPGTCSGAWDYSSQWVGIDGFSNKDLLQAGSAADVYCDVIGENEAEYFPWLEWLPESELVIYKSASTDTLYPFAPGDYLLVTVWATDFSGGSSTTGNLSYADVTQGWTLSLTFTASSVGGTEVVGKSAEWIMERTEVNGALATLPDYTADPWNGATATDLAAVAYAPGTPNTATAYNITMLDNNNADESYVSLFGTTALWFFPEGSAIK